MSKFEHRILIPLIMVEDTEEVRAPVPTYFNLDYADEVSAWIDIPIEDCRCQYASVEAWHAGLAQRYPDSPFITPHDVIEHS